MNHNQVRAHSAGRAPSKTGYTRRAFSGMSSPTSQQVLTLPKYYFRIDRYLFETSSEWIQLTVQSDPFSHVKHVRSCHYPGTSTFSQ